MACTSQSALDYVRNARRKLVNGLTGHSVILENLYQKKVFVAEHVSKVKAEKDDYDKNRTMLDFVIHNGEDACHELLKILYMTRKRTLGRRDAFDENKRFDLIHWISCYAFTEDTEMEENYLQGSRPCHRYQGKLKSKAQKISKKFWTSSRSLFEENKKPDLSYTSLVLDTQGSVAPSKIKKSKSKKSRMSRPKKLRTYIPEKKADISPSELLKMDKNLLIVGKPGIGKTALSLEMLRLWSERESKDLDYMFYFDMRETADITSTVSLEDLLFSKYCEPDEGKDEVLQDLKKYSGNVKIIFDGLTNTSSSVFQKLVEKELLPDATIILTCRPDDEDDFFSPEDCLTVEVKGFNEQTINSYLSGALGEDEEKVLSSVELLTLCHVPMYALMVVACFSSEVSTQPRTITEIYINLVRFCLQTNSNKTKTKHLNSFIKSKRKEILSLAEVAFHATLRKTVILEKVVCEDSCVLSFLKPLVIKVDFTEAITTHAFLHYTVQEFFAALWLLINPDKIREIFQQCLTDEQKHMKHLIPFMCRLLNEKKPSLMNCLIPVEEINKTSEWFFKEMKTTFLPAAHTEDTGLDVNLPFLCQCLYESQRPELCIYLLDKLDYSLDLSEENLDPYTCCAVAYLVTQSEERKVCLNLEDVTVSEEGMRQLFGCLGNVQNIQWCDPLPQHLWKIFLLSDWQMDSVTIIRLFGNQLHLPVEGKRQLFDRAVEVIQKMTEKVNVCLYWDGEAPFCHNLTESLFKVLSNINSLSFTWRKCHETLEREQKRLLLHLCLKAALDSDQTFYNAVNQLCSLMPVQTNLVDILFDLYQHVKSEELSLHPSLLSVFQSHPVWSIKLSERKTPILLGVLKLQSEKKPVELIDCSHEESEMNDFLECLPYISQLRLVPLSSDHKERTRLFVNLFCAAAEREQQTGEKMLEILSSVLPDEEYPIHRMDNDKKTYDPDFLLDLYFQMEDYETKTGLSLLPSLQPVFQSSHPDWFIILSKRKTSVLLEVLKLQSEKKSVELIYWSHEESEVKIFLQCLPYISWLGLVPRSSDLEEETRFLVNLFCAAAEREQQTGEKMLEMLSSVLPDEEYPIRGMNNDEKTYDPDFLLDLYFQMKNYETKTGLSLLPSLQPVFQSSPPDWSIKLSERKTSVLLEVLKLQSEKKSVELTDCSHEESEVKIILQCLPYISQLRLLPWSSDLEERTRLFVNLFCAAAEREQQTGEKMLEMLSSVLPDREYPIHWMNNDKKTYHPGFLLDLYFQMKNYETKTGLSLLPSLQPVFQSSPPDWSIDFSERKTSVLLEVLKLQSEKKSVKLRDCSHEESEVKIILQCLPYISQLRLVPRSSDQTRLFVNLFCAAAEREQQTGEKMLEILSSVLPDEEYPIPWMDNDKKTYDPDFLLDLYVQMKNYETKTGLSLLPSLQPVFQSSPPDWLINLSKRKTSVLLEVLKLQSEKKSVELIYWSHEESEVKIILQCLPYISQLRLVHRSSDDGTRFLVNLFCAAAEREQQTGEKMLEILSSVLPDEEYPIHRMDYDKKTYDPDFLLDLYFQMKNYETKTGLSLLPSLQPVFQSSPPDWDIDLSERKTSVLLEVLKLQSEKKSVELRHCSHEESEVKIILQCLPYISQLGLDYWSSDDDGPTRLLENLFCAAAEREQQTGEKMLEMLSSVLPDEEYPIHWLNNDKKTYDPDFLLDLYVQMKNYETKTGLSLLPSLQPVFQSSPPDWLIDLSERKTSVLLEVLKLQSEKKSVKLRDCSHEESEVKIILQCLPYISQLGCGPAFFQLVCTSISVRSREDLQQLVSLLKLLDFQLQLTGKLCRKTCSSVGRVLKMCSSKVDLILTSSKMSVRGAALLFRYTTQLHSLKLSNNMTTFLLRWVRRGRLILPLAVEELCLVSKEVQPAERVLKVVSSLASLLRYWTVGRLDLTEFSIPAQHLITLLLHDAPLTIRLSEVNIQQFLEIQDENLTVSLLGKVGGDLTSFCLSWELLQHLLQLPSAQTITVDLRKNRSLEERAADLLPCVDRIVFKRPSPSFVRTIIRELYRAHARVMVPSLLRSLDHVINLSRRELDSVDCAALLFILKHSDGVKLKLLWTIIPAEGIQSILLTLDKVTDLSVDRDLLLRFIHCCASSDGHQEAASALLKTLHHRLDVSCSSCVALPEEDQTDPPSLTTGDCHAICTILRHSSQETQLHLKDCEVEDSGLDLLFPVLDRVCLRVSKTVLLQLLSLIPVNSERDTARRAVTLCRALGGELDLSHTALDERLCGALVQILDLSEELTELDLSHCQLTDSLLLELVPHLHKVHILDLSHNRITDATTNDLVQLVSVNPSMDSIRLFGNNIVDKTRFQEHKQFEM